MDLGLLNDVGTTESMNDTGRDLVDDDGAGSGDLRVIGGVDDVITGDVVEPIVGGALCDTHRVTVRGTVSERLIPDVTGANCAAFEHR